MSEYVDLMLYFSSPTCNPCRQTSPIIDKHISEALETRIEKINIEDSFDLCVQFGVRSVPTVVCLNSHGEIINRMDGVSPSNLKKLLAI